MLTMHFDILFLLGLALFSGTIGGRLFQRLKIPQVVGYIVIGIILGESGLRLFDQTTIMKLQHMNYLALGLIGFMIGGELKRKVIVRYGKQFAIILFFEALTAFLLVTVTIGCLAGLFLDNQRQVWALALLLGAIASATAPAATTDVLWEYKTAGPLTRTVFGIVAMDDALALILFSLAASVAGVMIGKIEASVWQAMGHAMYEIVGAIVIGVVCGLILDRLIRKYQDEDKILAISLGMVLLVLGMALTFKINLLLAAMALGCTVVNFAPARSREIFRLTDRFTPPIYMLFFVLIGAKLNLQQLTFSLACLLGLYLLGRTVGKYVGARIGSKLSGAPLSVQKYLPFCLFSQAGVAIGLSLMASQQFPNVIGNSIVVIITASTFIVQIVGPPAVKYAVSKAGEVGLNITEADLIKQSKVKDVMTAETPVLHENTPVSEMLRTFSENESLYFPVADDDQKLIGVVSIDTIKETFMTQNLNQFLLAADLMDPVELSTRADTPLAEVKELFKRRMIGYLPIVDREKRVVGGVEARAIDRLITQKLNELHLQASALG